MITERVESQRRSKDMKRYSDGIRKAKARKSALTGRVGVVAEARKYSSTLSVSTPVQIKEAKAKEEFPSLDDGVYIDGDLSKDVDEIEKAAETRNEETEETEDELIIMKEV